ncbi:MAG: hypothetical protein M3P06_19090 [Acidobacteriota bacterium]|nr:hypothetical protein [Acidobacteriota bacterium]
MKKLLVVLVALSLIATLPACKPKTETAKPQEELAVAPPSPSIVVSSAVPAELNGPFNAGPPITGGAPNATPAQAAAFAWNEFIALNWPAGPQAGQNNQRDTPSSTCKFGDPNCTGPTVWETFRHKAETFPGAGNPPGYVNDAAVSYGYDALPQYTYNMSVPACDPSQSGDAVPWVNLDETDEIGLASMYAGVVQDASSPNNSDPQLIRFLAKSNRAQYVYVTSNSDPNNTSAQWWSAIPLPIAQATANYLATNKTSPPAGSSTMVSNPDNTIEIKAGWRALNPNEASGGRFHMQMVRFYEGTSAAPCYRDAVWGLVALHIIQKTPSAPYFIYATFEQADNILTANGTPVEDADGNIVQPAPSTATTPQVCLNDPQPPSGTGSGTSALGEVIFTADPTTCTPLPTAVYCDTPGSQLYYHNDTAQAPSLGNICVNRRDNDIPDYIISANQQAHAAIAQYLQANNIPSAPWLYYKLINVQYYPYDKVITTQTPNGSLYTSQAPYTAQNPSPSSYYMANIVVETNRALQLFSGGLSPNICTDWNADGTPHKNTYYGGIFHNQGGCMGCHGSQGQNRLAGNGNPQPGDFSVILAKGRVKLPEIPALQTASGAMTKVERNRTTTSGRGSAK